MKGGPWVLAGHCIPIAVPGQCLGQFGEMTPTLFCTPCPSGTGDPMMEQQRSLGGWSSVGPCGDPQLKQGLCPSSPLVSPQGCTHHLGCPLCARGHLCVWAERCPGCDGAAALRGCVAPRPPTSPTTPSQMQPHCSWLPHGLFSVISSVALLINSWVEGDTPCEALSSPLGAGQDGAGCAQTDRQAHTDLQTPGPGEQPPPGL